MSVALGSIGELDQLSRWFWLVTNPHTIYSDIIQNCMSKRTRNWFIRLALHWWMKILLSWDNSGLSLPRACAKISRCECRSMSRMHWTFVNATTGNILNLLREKWWTTTKISLLCFSVRTLIHLMLRFIIFFMSIANCICILSLLFALYVDCMIDLMYAI